MAGVQNDLLFSIYLASSFLDDQSNGEQCTHKRVISFKQCKSMFGQRHCQRFPETGACAKTGTTPAIQPASYSTTIIANNSW